MKSTLYLLLALSLIILSGCNKKNTNDSIWVEAFSERNNKDSFSPSGNTLIDLQKNKLIIVDFNNVFDNNNPKTFIDSLDFSPSSSSINYKGEIIKVVKNKNTLTLQFKNFKKVYRRLKKEWKNKSKINLVKKEYHFENSSFPFNVEFLNDSLNLFFVKNEDDSKYPIEKWIVTEYKDYKFLIFNSSFPDTKYLIIKSNKNQLKMLNLNSNYFVNENATFIPPIEKEINLQGNWESIKTLRVSIPPSEKDTIINPTQVPPPPPPPSHSVEPFEFDKFNLVFLKDSISINNYGDLSNQTWSLASNKERIILEKRNKKGKVYFSAWQILGINDTTMTFKMNTKYSSTSKDIVTFKKIN